MSIIDEALKANATTANDYDAVVRSRGAQDRNSHLRGSWLSDIEQLLGLAQADVDMIRNFGTVIDDDAIRSLVLSTHLLGSGEIMIINHTDCGMLRFTDSELEERLARRQGRRRTRG